MANIVAGVGCSHVPAIGAALDLGKTGEDYWKPVFDGFARSQRSTGGDQTRHRNRGL